MSNHGSASSAQSALGNAGFLMRPLGALALGAYVVIAAGGRVCY